MKKRTWKILLSAAAVILVVLVCISSFVLISTSDKLYGTVGESGMLGTTELAAVKNFKADVICVLGCRVNEDGTPGVQLKDRLDAGIYLYNQGIADCILITGSDGKNNGQQDETDGMYAYLLEKEIPAEAIIVDGEGYSTFDSMYHLSHDYNFNKAVIVTQRYHIQRALYMANKSGVDAIGVSAGQRTYGNEAWLEVREFLARIKDFGNILFGVKSAY